jgi:hypothetical protein
VNICAPGPIVTSPSFDNVDMYDAAAGSWSSTQRLSAARTLLCGTSLTKHGIAIFAGGGGAVSKHVEQLELMAASRHHHCALTRCGFVLRQRPIISTVGHFKAQCGALGTELCVAFSARSRIFWRGANRFWSIHWVDRCLQRQPQHLDNSAANRTPKIFHQFCNVSLCWPGVFRWRVIRCVACRPCFCRSFMFALCTAHSDSLMFSYVLFLMPDVIDVYNSSSAAWSNATLIERTSSLTAASVEMPGSLISAAALFGGGGGSVGSVLLCFFWNTQFCGMNFLLVFCF